MHNSNFSYKKKRVIFISKSNPIPISVNFTTTKAVKEHMSEIYFQSMDIFTSSSSKPVVFSNQKPSLEPTQGPSLKSIATLYQDCQLADPKL